MVFGFLCCIAFWQRIFFHHLICHCSTSARIILGQRRFSSNGLYLAKCSAEVTCVFASETNFWSVANNLRLNGRIFIRLFSNYRFFKNMSQVGLIGGIPALLTKPISIIRDRSSLRTLTSKTRFMSLLFAKGNF